MITESINTALLDGDNERVYEMIFGDTDPDTLEFSLDHFIANELKARPSDLLFFELSVSAVFGIQLSNSQSIVFKFFPESYGREHLEAVIKTQKSLYERGFPCPKPLTECHTLCSAIGYAEELVEEGSFQEAGQPFVLSELAEKQCALQQILTELDCRGLNEYVIAREIKEMTDLAARAHEVICAHEPNFIVGHGDWGVKCTRFHENKLVAAFDWYSLVREDELVLVGVTAASYWQSNQIGQDMEPNTSFMEKYLAAYVSARGKPFTASEDKVIRAAMSFKLTQMSLPKLAGELLPT